MFGRRKEPHTVIIAQGDKIRHFTVRPWAVAVAGSAISAIAIGYLAATSYLVLRDDLLGAAVARQAQLQHAYEDRISALRGQVDRITSRQLLDQQLVESKVTELLDRQTRLSQRHGRLEPILSRTDAPAPLPADAPLPVAKPDLRAALDATEGSSGELALLDNSREKTPALLSMSRADRADKLFTEINQSLRTIESDQLEKLDALASDAYQATGGIKDALASVGLKLDDDQDHSAVGGPYLPADPASSFDVKVREVDEALEELENLKAEAKRLPLANPAEGRAVTSTFGVRKDPLLGSPALHSGIDFRTPIGASAVATAAGKVVKAGWNGGYGRMVEIDHGNGFSTRYAHLSRIDVSEGDAVSLGQTIGETGSSGRSTGPHLHYEVRKGGSAVDPLRFLKAGKTISKFL